MPSYGATATQAVFAENRVITFLAFWLEVACENDYRDMHKIWEDGPQPPPQRPLLITHTHTHRHELLRLLWCCVLSFQMISQPRLSFPQTLRGLSKLMRLRAGGLAVAYSNLLLRA